MTQIVLGDFCQRFWTQFSCFRFFFERKRVPPLTIFFLQILYVRLFSEKGLFDFLFFVERGNVPAAPLEPLRFADEVIIK